MYESDHETFRLLLRELAPMLGKLRRNRWAKPSYEWMSGALIWSDELPRPLGVARGVEVMRFVFRYRTSLMLGKPESEWEPFWNLARELFPDWPGFVEDRRSPRHIPVYRAGEEAMFKELEFDASDP